jgi:hypothetical protein
MVVAEDDNLHLGVSLQDLDDKTRRAFEAQAGIDQHQVRTEPADDREGLIRRGAAADHLVGCTPRKQRLQRLVEQWL